MSRCLVGDGILLFVTLCWDIFFPLLEKAVVTVDPSVFATSIALLLKKNINAQ
jgi:hypothetical protein